MFFELLSSINESCWGQECAYKIKHVIGTLILILAMLKYPVKAPPLRGFTRMVNQSSLLKHSGNLSSCTTVTKKARKCFKLVIGKWRNSAHLVEPPKTSVNNPSASFSTASRSARISSSGRRALGL